MFLNNNSELDGLLSPGTNDDESKFNYYLKKIKKMRFKCKVNRTDLFVFIGNSGSLNFWENFFNKLREKQAFWKNEETASVFFSSEEHFNQINSKVMKSMKSNDIMKYSGKKFDSYIEVKSSLDKFIYNNIKKRMEKDENLQIYLSNEFQEFEENENYENIKAYEIFFEHLDKKLFEEEFDREIAKELFYPQFMEKEFIKKEDIFIFYGNALQKIENTIKKITNIIKQKKENKKIRIIIFEAFNLKEFVFEKGDRNAPPNLIKNLGINKISIQIKYGEQIFESETELNANFSLDLKHLEANFSFDPSNHKKGFTIKFFDKKNENLGSYQLKINDWVTKTKGRFDLDYIRKQIEKERTMIEMNEIKGDIPCLKLFFSHLNSFELENEIDFLNYDLDRWIKAKIDLNFFKVNPDLRNQLNLINKRFEEINSKKDQRKLSKTLTFDEIKDIDKLMEKLKKKKEDFKTMKKLLEEKQEKKKDLQAKNLLKNKNIELEKNKKKRRI